ncbi:GNAT family N-acetyltransferase [Gilvimarinus xylanilyticus]|uniref:GNAT family N-acetyltransferase n=1 Tax=Gilvimarinus xylanilyticus TaxID=2944139 RepID=A0A9X2I1M4_9GAMM|nr:GNAT family N-acetyltransferase [Gilvimarinus xylanilyticus]MCP8899033.1 GNAT family N-acetyltransferase [Gilvimarinus xylanilyticus]
MALHALALQDYPTMTRLYRAWGEKAKCGKRDRVYTWQAPDIMAAARILEPAAGVYLLRHLTVAPEHRRRGVARSLMQALLPLNLPLYCYCRPYLGGFYQSLGLVSLAAAQVPAAIAEPYERYQKNGKDFMLMGTEVKGEHKGV